MKIPLPYFLIAFSVLPALAQEDVSKKVQQFLDTVDEPVKILDYAAQAYWSPDGNHIAFTIKPNNDDSSAGIGILTLDGSKKVRKLTTSGKDPVWSPDGKWIVYTNENMNGYQESVWVIPADGEGEPEFLSEGGYPSWYPDSETVLYHSRLDMHLYNIPVTGEDKQSDKLIEMPFPYPAFSNDGKILAMGFPDIGLITTTLDQSSTKQYKTELLGFLGRWSPDNSNICYGGYLQANMGLHVIDASFDKKPVQLLEGSWTRPAWSPDGEYIVYDSGKLPFEVWILKVENMKDIKENEVGF